MKTCDRQSWHGILKTLHVFSTRWRNKQNWRGAATEVHSHVGRASALEAKPLGAALSTQYENIHTRITCLSCSVALDGMLLVDLTLHTVEQQCFFFGDVYMTY